MSKREKESESGMSKISKRNTHGGNGRKNEDGEDVRKMTGRLGSSPVTQCLKSSVSQTRRVSFVSNSDLYCKDGS